MGIGRSSSCGLARQWHGLRIRRKHATSSLPRYPAGHRPSTRNHKALLRLASLLGAHHAGGAFPLARPCSTWGRVIAIQEAPMAMTMTGEVQLPATRQAVWDKLNDP